jgi:hypothetical protein
VKTLFGQYSTQRGLPNLAQPSHLSEKITGNQGACAVVIFVHLNVRFLFLPIVYFENVIFRIIDV